MAERTLKLVTEAKVERWIVKNASTVGSGKWRITLELEGTGERRIFTAPNNPRSDVTQKRLYEIRRVLLCVPEDWEEITPGGTARAEPLAETVAKLPAAKQKEPEEAMRIGHAEPEPADLDFADIVDLLPKSPEKEPPKASESKRVEKSSTGDEVDEMLREIFLDGGVHEKSPAAEKVTLHEMKDELRSRNVGFLMYKGLEGSLSETEFEKVVNYKFDWDEHVRAYDLITGRTGKLDSITNNVAAQIIGVLGEESVVERIMESGLEVGKWFAKEAKAIKASEGL